MRNRYFLKLVIVLGLAALALLFLQIKNHKDQTLNNLQIANNANSGGETTIYDTSREAFAKSLANLPTKKLRDFTFGNKMFNTNWVEAPASVTSLDGLGPTFNRVSCSGCHFKDGRGRPPHDQNEPMLSMLIRLSIPGKDTDGGPNPHPIYGGQLNSSANNNIPAEGTASIIYEEIAGNYLDGENFSLRKPVYIFSEMAFGELGKDTMFSPRVAPAVHGLGLLEAIDKETILSFADPNDENHDGISGRPNYVPDLKGEKTIGRFGWKANVATLKQQDAGAALGDIGITTSLNPKQNCPKAQTACLEAIEGGTPEMSDKQLAKLIFYSRTLAPPARRDINDPEVIRGGKLFMKYNCSSCHIPQMRTGHHEIAELSGQNIQPFTDLLLHDMGEDLADNRPDYEANGKEWRTPPLWGIGLVPVVNKHSNYLHDGRARNLAEAILWHGGEAEKSKEEFKAASKEDRAALLKFLESL